MGYGYVAVKFFKINSTHNLTHLHKFHPSTFYLYVPSKALKSSSAVKKRRDRPVQRRRKKENPAVNHTVAAEAAHLLVLPHPLLNPDLVNHQSECGVEEDHFSWGGVTISFRCFPLLFWLLMAFAVHKIV